MIIVYNEQERSLIKKEIHVAGLDKNLRILFAKVPLVFGRDSPLSTLHVYQIAKPK